VTAPLDDSQRFWDAHARRDPLWAVLSEAGKEARRWDVRRFFQTGLNEVALMFYELESRGITVHHGAALDFGCGVGRLTQALAARFAQVVGVDVSPKMIETATALNPFPERARFVWNAEPHLRPFDDATFDFIYTNLVLQHIVPEISEGYLREFVRLLRPDGVLVFQLPSHPRGPDDPRPESTAIAMAEGAYHARIAVAALPEERIEPGTAITLDVDVTNISGTAWLQQQCGAIRLGNHWLDRTGERTLQRDDGRTLLPETMPPGLACRVPLTITTPAEAGDYVCELDLAHEGVRWFHDQGSTVLRFAVNVGSGGGEPARSIAPESRSANRTDLPSFAPGDLSAADPGDFPMHGINTERVEQLIAAVGGDLVLKTDDHSCGPSWISHRYVVRKR
jgi:SAM-dependent methyltransferase